jgi:hypothetical protein
MNHRMGGTLLPAARFVVGRDCGWAVARLIAFGNDEQFIFVAPHPGFARFEGADNGVTRFREMLTGMLIFGIVAAADMATDQAQAQMHPGVAHLQTFLASFRCSGGHILNLGHVLASFRFMWT